MITWKKSNHTSCIVGSIGEATFEEREHFYIHKVKPPSAPRSKWSQRRNKRQTGEAWHFEYTLHERRKGETHRVGELFNVRSREGSGGSSVGHRHRIGR